MIITLLPAIAFSHPQKRSPFTSQKAIALPHPKKRSPLHIPNKRSL
ncbi:MAG: hypothetical protein ACKPFD_04490 [Dolichospermum sp.]